MEKENTSNREEKRLWSLSSLRAPFVIMALLVPMILTASVDKVIGQPVDTVPPNTSVTKAVDGNNAVLSLTNPSAAATVSKKITITFTGTDSVGIARFQCSLDLKPFSSCTSPITFNNLALGTHNFRVRAIDTAGNVDPTPASFTWTVLTPAQGVQKLIDTISTMNINPVFKNSLISQLKSVKTIITDGSPNNDATACVHLDSFIVQVRIQSQLGILTTSQANQIIQTLPYSGQAIKTSIGCV